MKKIISVVFLTLMVVSLWAAGSRSTAASKISFAAVNTTVLTPFEEIFNRYKSRAGIDVDIQTMPYEDQYIMTRFATKDYPDAFLWDPGTKQYTKFRIEELYNWTGDPLFDKVLPATRQFQTLNGEIYGVPWGGTNGIGVYYNKDVFAKAGVQPPNNYSDFINILTKIKAAGIDPIYEANNTGWPMQCFTLAGWPTYVDSAIGAQGVARLEINQLDLADIPALQQLFQLYLDLGSQGFFQDNYRAGTFEEQCEALGSGQVAMAFQIGTVITTMIDMFGKDHINRTIGFFPLPSATDKGTACLVPATQIMVPRNAGNAQGAVEMVRFMTEKENLDLYYRYNTGIPVYQGVQSELMDYMKTIAEFDNSGKAMVNVQNRLSSSFTDLVQILQVMQTDRDVRKAAQTLSDAYKRTGRARALPGF